MLDRIGLILKEYRRANGLTQTKVAAMLGCHQSHITDMERGMHMPSVPILLGISKITNVPIVKLLGATEEGQSERVTIDVTDLSPADRDYIEFTVNMLKEYAKRNSEPAEVESAQGFIYFVASPEAQRIKIGYTADPDTRIYALLNSSPSPLETLNVIEGTVTQERELHRRFSHLRVHREWFTDCPELREYINSL